ncbi:hypothetical protein [uncultured Thermanaerothrix sp.]|uniref:hypothetical protein n=1 Tax=uncultured Thermanaerothrix sp. TaxID=1195149 RepID=UPI002605023C|nr:hypothetical protein [uncultured Thermanaerothrix sp.]
MNGNWINTAQRNFIHASLQSFEETLALAEGWLEKRVEMGTLYRYQLHLTPEREAEVRCLIQAAREELATMSVALGLRPRGESVNRLLSGHFSQCWAELVDTHPQRLRGYGAVDPHLPETFGSAFEHLADLALRLSRLFGEESPAPVPSRDPGRSATGMEGDNHA